MTPQNWLTNSLGKVYAQFQDTGIFKNPDEFNALYLDNEYGNRQGMTREEYNLAVSLAAIRQQAQAYFPQGVPVTNGNANHVAPAPQAVQVHSAPAPDARPRLPVATATPVPQNGAYPPMAQQEAPVHEEDPQAVLFKALTEALLLHSPVELGITPAIDESILKVLVAYPAESDELKEILDIVMRRLIIPIMRSYGILALQWAPVIPQVDAEGNVIPVPVPAEDEGAIERWWKTSLSMQHFLPGIRR